MLLLFIGHITITLNILDTKKKNKNKMFEKIKKILANYKNYNEQFEVNSDNKFKNKIVFEGSEYEAIILKGLLESKGINVFQNNYVMQTSEPWLINPGGYKPSTIMVTNDDFISAKKIIDNYLVQ